MGNCFSDPSSKKGKGQKLGSAPPPSAQTQTPERTQAAAAPSGEGVKNYEPPRTLGGTGSPGVTGEEDPRVRAMMAAEERANAVSVRSLLHTWPHPRFLLTLSFHSDSIDPQ